MKLGSDINSGSVLEQGDAVSLKKGKIVDLYVLIMLLRYAVNWWCFFLLICVEQYSWWNAIAGAPNVM